MRIKIEIVTGYSTYSSLIWTKENQEQYPTHPDYQHEDDQEYFKQIHQDEEIRPDDEVSNNWKDLSEFYQDKINDPNNMVVILRADHMKRGYYNAEIESDKPFNINYLSVTDGEISYGMHTIEYLDGGEGYDSETQIYCDTDGDE
jgi:2-oxoglutarate dehydrogenase complex dehydrogenase (E1) component-like enzyme